MHRLAALVVTWLVAAPAAAAQEAHVYSSLPLTGAAASQATAIVNGARLALSESGAAVTYTSLDDASRRFGTWTPAAESRNARRAAGDPAAIAYIGAFNSGASAVSMPVLNKAGIVQISPTNTHIGLTRDGPGSTDGEPEQYRPSGANHYVRLAPNDQVQGAALATAMAEDGCRRVAVVTDGEVYGAGVGASVGRSARVNGLRVVARGVIDPRAQSYGRFARRLRARRAQCVVFTGITANGAVRLFRALAGALPRARLFGSDGIAESGFTGRLPSRVARRVSVSVLTLPPDEYPPAGQDFFRRFEAAYSDPNPDPYAIYGYEAMRLVLDALSAAGNDRAAVRQWLLGVRERASVLGTYGFDPFGDISTRDYGIYGIRGGALVFERRVTAR